jgi:hypothetical protein
MKPTRSHCARSVHDFETYHRRHVAVTTNYCIEDNDDDDGIDG